MKKIFNYRPIVFCAILVIFGIAVSVYALKYSLISLLFIIPAVLVALLFAFKKSRKFVSKHLLMLCFALLFLVLSVCSFTIYEKSYSEDKCDENFYYVSGTISNVENKDGFILVELCDVDLLSQTTFEAKHLNKNLLVFFSYTESEYFVDINTGDGIGFRSNIYYLDLFDQLSSYNDCSCANMCNLSSDTKIIHYKDNKTDVFSYLRLNIKQTLFSNMDEDTASVCYAMLFGDRSVISESTEEAFSVSGIMHLLAVSGLHIGFLVLLLNFVFGLFIKRKEILALVVCFIAFGYGFLCGFSASVSRALVMAVVSYLSIVRGEQYDGINSLSVSSLLILLCFPTQLFSVGMRLSFLIVLSIFCLMPLFNFWLSKVMHQKIASLLALGFAAQIGSFPLVIYYFGEVGMLSLLSNFVIVPIASIGYMFLFVILPIVLIIPALSFLLYLPKLIMWHTILIAKSVAGAGATIQLTTNSMSCYLFYGGIICASDYFNSKYKWYISLLLFVCAIGIVLLFI